jgi:L-iditol 2-dehydrogenase
MLARQAGARVILAGKGGPRLALADRLGFAACLDVASEADPVGLVRGAAGGGVRCAIDATGRPEAWEQAIGAVDKGGTVVFFGGCAPGTSIRLDTRRVHYEELRLVGVFHHTPALIRRAVAMLAEGALDPSPLVTDTMALGEVPEALARMSRGEVLKVLIDPAR